MKKLVSFALALIFLLSLAAIPVFAEDTHIGCEINFAEYSIQVTGKNECAFTRYEGKDRHFKIPETLENYTVTSIGDYAFSKNYYLTAVEIPATVKSIGEGAFFYCYNLSTVTIPDTVESIGEKAFGFNRRKFDTETCTYTYRADPAFTVYASENSAGAKFAKENGYELNINELYNDFANGIIFHIPYQWSDFTNIYCHIWDLETGEAFTNWQSNAEKCDVYFDQVQYNADYGVGFSLSYDTVYGIVFSTDTGEQTFPAIYHYPRTSGYLCTSDVYVRTPKDEAPTLQAKWWNGRDYEDLSAYEEAFGIYKDAVFFTQDEATADEPAYEEALPWGDANCDGKVNVRDATAIQKHIAGIEELSDTGLLLCDFFTKYEPITVKEATIIQKHCAGMPKYTDIIVGKAAVTRVCVERPHAWYRQEMTALSIGKDGKVIKLNDTNATTNTEEARFYVPIYNNDIAFVCGDYTTKTYTVDFFKGDRDGYNDYVFECFQGEIGEEILFSVVNFGE